ncbi:MULTISPECIES: BCCT family transporter [Curtobacterium]|uniref:BCCT family transporter n=1 Tax=Curtobacterium TaxID=2034 RepID=UPI001E329386|nr:BCCT family transporter [Curtobacterium flaccumfaciens]MCS6575719.1 BCCT family transporter [Curtobacterium flaccumfaciens pv. flaccumfaciens]MCU0151291.1 BCCT family transporter [Curtobacterium flaccumfaciens pv. poinsettiae]UXN16689.1 BCCT family transporter [Curtobacterium flaccumfaciens pv. poinsettiae]
MASTTPPLPGPVTTTPQLRRWVFWPAAVIVLGFVAFTLISPSTAEAMFLGLQDGIVQNFSWYYVLIAAFFVGFSLFVGFSRFGDIKLGKDQDEPEFSTGSWFALLFAAGMGIGLVFYGVSEPLSHFASPRPGVTGNEKELAQQALTQTFLHWGLHAWAIYVVLGLALAYAIHRRGRPVSIRWALEPLLGNRVRGGWGNLIDVIALVGTLFGVATSLGLGVIQIGAGLESAGIADSSIVSQIAIIAVITAVTIVSLVTGVTKGMKILSNFNLLLAAALLLFVLIVGPTQFLLRDFVQSIGSYLQNIVGLSFNVTAQQGAEGEAWQGAWTTFYWGWWMSWAPFVGVFIARISKGRTVRQFVFGVLLVPTALTFLWFAVLGGAAIHRQTDGAGGLVGSDGSVDIEGSLFALLGDLPAGVVLTYGAILLIGVFFVTSSDSGSLVMAMIASGGDIEPKNWLRVFFAAVSALLAVALLLSGGLNALKTAAITTALPFSIVLILTCWSTIIAFTRERRAYDKAEREVLLEHVGAYYGLEVEAPSERPARSALGRPWAAVKSRVRGGRGAAAPTVEAGALEDFPVRPESISPDPAVDPSLDARPTSADTSATVQPER